MSEIITDPLAPAEPVAEPAEPAWAGPSADEWGQVTQTLGYLADLAQQSQAPGEGQQYAAIDPFADNFGEQLSGYIGRAFEEHLGPIKEWQQGQMLGEAEERALDIIEDDVSRNGEFMLGEKAFEGIRALANVFMSEESQRYGYGPKAAESALARAASEWRAYEKELAQKAIEQHMNQLTNLAGAGREPGASSLGVSQQFQPTPGDELALVRKYGGFPGS